MGWNALALTRPSALLDGLDGADVYFAHSFAAEPDDAASSTATSITAAPSSPPSRRAARRRPVPPRAERARGRRVLENAPGMVKKRVIPCLDVAGGRVVKGVNFVNLREMGEPVELATRYSELGADELVFLDITATLEGRGPILEVIERSADELTIPFTVGGGITGLDDARACCVQEPTRSRSTAPRSTTRRSSPRSPTSSARRRSSARSTRGRGGRHARGPNPAAATRSTGRARRSSAGRARSC